MKLSLAKTTRKSSAEGLWAISYADFLMVLLSFFIIFFSMEKNENKTATTTASVLDKVVINFQDISDGAKSSIGAHSNGAAKSSVGVAQIGNTNANITATAIVATNNNLLDKALMKDVLSKIKGAKVALIHDEEKIILNLADNIYGVGKYKVPYKVINNVISKLKGYEDKIQITIVGYSDNMKFVGKNARVVRDNSTLSAVRASYAANYIKMKSPKFKVNTQTGEGVVRNTRSISLVITGLKEKTK